MRVEAVVSESRCSREIVSAFHIVSFESTVFFLFCFFPQGILVAGCRNCFLLCFFFWGNICS